MVVITEKQQGTYLEQVPTLKNNRRLELPEALPHKVSELLAYSTENLKVTSTATACIIQNIVSW